MIETKNLNLEELAEMAAKLLSIRDRPLNDEELAAVHACVYPHFDPYPADIRLQTGQIMPPAVVEAELGADMKRVYAILESQFSFRRVGAKQHAPSAELRRHLWDSAFKAHLMGLPLEVRMAALMHELPEYMASEVPLALSIIDKIRDGFEKGEKVANYVMHMTDFGAIVVRDVFRRIGTNDSNGTADSDAYNSMVDRRLAALRDDSPDSPAEVKQAYGVAKVAIRDALAAARAPSKRVVPVTADSPNWLLDEAIARVNPSYAKSVYNRAREMVDDEKPDYDAILLVSAIASIDGLRTTMGGFSKIEQASREAMNLLPGLHRMVMVLERSDIHNNALLFLTRALTTEAFGLLEQEVGNFERRPDTTARYGARLLKERFDQLRKEYSLGVIPRVLHN